MVLKITAGLFAQYLQAACNIQDIILNLKGQTDTGADFLQTVLLSKAAREKIIP